MKIFKNSMIGAVTLALAFIATPAAADAVSTAGDVSFGYGLSSSAGSLVEWGNDLTIDYWLDDSMAVGGGVNINYMSASQGDASSSSTEVGLDVGITYVLAAGEKTRLTVGGGIGLTMSMSDDGRSGSRQWWGCWIRSRHPLPAPVPHCLGSHSRRWTGGFQ